MTGGGGEAGLTRRGLLISAGAAAAAVAVGVPLGIALWPRPTPVEAMRARDPFVVAHRGGAKDWPEMSALAYEHAAPEVDALEMSVARTSDGVWFGCHDTTLDRLSGTSGFVVADHTWAEVQRYRIKPPSAHRGEQSPQPYLTFEEFVSTYQDSKALWVDPKAVDARHYGELAALMRRLVSHPGDVFVAKSDAGNREWARLAKEHRMQSWGFYFARDLAQDPAEFGRTNAPWTMLGLDWDAPAELWRTFRADGRPLVAHVLTARDQRVRALREGARGLMVSGVTEVVGRA